MKDRYGPYHVVQLNHKLITKAYSAIAGTLNRLGRFRESEILRHIFERVVATCMAAGLVKGESFAVDASELVSLPDLGPRSIAQLARLRQQRVNVDARANKSQADGI